MVGSGRLVGSGGRPLLDPVRLVTTFGVVVGFVSSLTRLVWKCPPSL